MKKWEIIIPINIFYKINNYKKIYIENSEYITENNCNYIKWWKNDK